MINDQNELMKNVDKGIQHVNAKTRFKPLIVTGRSYASFCNINLPKFFLALFNPIAIFNAGNVVFNHDTNQYTTIKTIAPSLFDCVLKSLQQISYFIVESKGILLTNSPQAKQSYLRFNNFRSFHFEGLDLNHTNLENITEIIIVPKEGEQENVRQELIELANLYTDTEFFYQERPYGYQFLISPYSCKLVGLKSVLSELGINMQDVMAFGNDDNDSLMLRKSRCGIAVKESSKLAIDASDVHLDIELGDFLLSL